MVYKQPNYWNNKAWQNSTGDESSANYSPGLPFQNQWRRRHWEWHWRSLQRARPRGLVWLLPHKWPWGKQGLGNVKNMISKTPLEAGMAGVNSRNLSDVLCKAIEDWVSVIQGAPLKLATRWRSSKREREGQAEAKGGVNVGKRDWQGGCYSKDERSLRIEGSLNLSINIVADWREVGRVVVVWMVSENEGGEEREPCEVGHRGDGTPLALMANSDETFLWSPLVSSQRLLRRSN